MQDPAGHASLFVLQSNNAKEHNPFLRKHANEVQSQMDNNNKNHGKVPKLPPSGSFMSYWSVFLGGLGLVSGCLPLFSIWNLPAGLFLGLGGIACAVLSRHGKPFTQQAQLGLILSVISLVCGLLMSLFIIFVYDTMDTNTALGRYFRDTIESTTQVLAPSRDAGQ